MTRINIHTAKNDGHETIFAPESIELRMELKQVFTFIRDGKFYVDVRFECPARDPDPRWPTVTVKREVGWPLAMFANEEIAAWRKDGTLPSSCMRSMIRVACFMAMQHEIDEMYHNAEGKREVDPHKGDGDA